MSFTARGSVKGGEGAHQGYKSNHEEVVIGCEHDLHPHLIPSSVQLKICLCLRVLDPLPNENPKNICPPRAPPPGKIPREALADEMSFAVSRMSFSAPP